MENNKFGYVFGQGLRFGGYLILIFGLFLLVVIIGIIFTGKFETPFIVFLIISPILILLGGFISFTKHGVLIDIEKRKFSAYSKYFWSFVQVNWKTLEGYPLITILSFNRGSTTYSRTNQALTITDMKYEIYLLNEKQTVRK